jgi:hypothetical protein
LKFSSSGSSASKPCASAIVDISNYSRVTDVLLLATATQPLIIRRNPQAPQNFASPKGLDRVRRLTMPTLHCTQR